MALIDELFGQVIYDYNFQALKYLLKHYRGANHLQKNRMLREYAQVKGIILINQDYIDISN